MLKLEDYGEAIAKCSRCGYCQATCPVFRHDLLETHLARARIDIIDAVFLKGAMPLTPRVREIIDRCLLCTNCTQTCPGQVPVDEIITAARARLAAEEGIGLKKVVLNRLLKQRGLAGILGKAGSLAQRAGMGGDLPKLAREPFERRYSGTIPAIGVRKGRVLYFVGCGTNFIFPDTGEAVVKVLARMGIEVVIPEGQVCCGLPALAEGDLGTAMEAIRTNTRVLSSFKADAVITDCTSCGMMFKAKAPKVLAPDDPLKEDLFALAAKTWEVTDFLVQNGFIANPGEVKATVTYHVPCHRGWNPTVKDAPRRLARMVPGLNLVEMEEPEACCGAAGTFYLGHRELSEGIRKEKLNDIKGTGADRVITQCPVCRFYLASGLKDKEVVHPINLLAQAYGIS